MFEFEKEKPQWLQGAPKANGLYWFDSGFEQSPDKLPLVVKVRGNYSEAIGHFGLFPLKMIYQEDIPRSVRHMPIPAPTSWKKSQDCKLSGRFEAWVKIPEGYTGVGLLQRDSYGFVGSIIWLTHPDVWFSGGAWIRPEQNIELSELERP